jgi:hypothetical protein
MAIAPGKKGTVVGFAHACEGCASIAVRFTFDADNMKAIPLISEVINVGTWTTLSGANGINGDGVIVGYGDNDKGIDRPFMLIPQASR